MAPGYRLYRSLALLSLVCAALCGCSSKETQAQDAYVKYQTAAAANDMVGAQQALMQLVAINDGVANYWLELGKIQAASGNLGEAYNSFTRAYELDRSNAGVLRALTEFALREGDPAKAQDYARELEVILPGDPWVKLTQGYVALRESRYDEVLSASNAVLETSPFDSHAKAMKARALIGKQQAEEAVLLLKEQVRVQPDDVISLQILSNLYEQRGDWPRLAQIARRLARLQPGRSEPALLAVKAAFKAGQAAQGRRDSWTLLTSGGEANLVSRVLDIWIDNWPAPQRSADAVKLGRAAGDPRAKVAYADFLNRVGSPAAALELSAGATRSQLAADTANAHAVTAEALGLTGKISEARKRFADVLAFDPGNTIALRARAELFLRMSKAAEAVTDAQKLVTVAPAVARHRLLLASAYTSAGEVRQAERTLWDAFRDIPADEQIYSALVRRTDNDTDRRLALKEEFARQIAEKIDHGML